MVLDANFSVSLDATFGEMGEFGADFGSEFGAEFGADFGTNLGGGSMGGSVVVSAITKVASVFLPSSAWRGSNGVYSQVVAVSGVTDKSQVNLTPSAEQLAIFYDKSLAFVTENDGGVVTVYAIGQKPVNDYTIKATITEVSV